MGSQACMDNCNNFGNMFPPADKSRCEERAGPLIFWGVIFTAAGIIAASVFSCGICVCCCFEDSSRRMATSTQPPFPAAASMAHHPQMVQMTQVGLQGGQPQAVQIFPQQMLNPPTIATAAYATPGQHAQTAQIPVVEATITHAM